MSTPDELRGHEPRLPRPPIEPPMSRAAAILLNLTGLGLGYGYLRRRWLAGLSAAGTVALIVAAFWTDAASAPWLWRGVAAAWLGLAALGGWGLAARHLRPTDRQQWTRPVAVGAVLLLVFGAGYVAYGMAGRGAYDDGLAAQARGDCATAIDRFDEVTGRYELTLSGDVADAQASRQMCEEYSAAGQAGASGSYADAVRRYGTFRTSHPESTLLPFVHEDLIRTYGTWAEALLEDKDYPQAITVYRDLLDELGAEPDAESVREQLANTYLVQAEAWVSELASPPELPEVKNIVDNLAVIADEFVDTPASAKVAQTANAMFTKANSAFGAGLFCESLPLLDYVTGLTTGVVGEILPTAHANRSTALLQCGLYQFDQGQYANAAPNLEELLLDYPDNPQAAQAQSALIAAEVGDTANVPLSLPAPLGDDSPGSIRITFYNDSSIPVHVRLAGPTAHEFNIAGCPSCPAAYSNEAAACPTLDGLPSYTLFLVPGTYHVVAENTEAPGNPYVTTIPTNPSFFYTQCLFGTRF